MGNGGNGITINASDSDTVGGVASGDGNVISGNSGDGVEIISSGSTSNLVAGNFIGTNAAGTAAIANGTNGVEIDSGATGNTIGGTTAGTGNLISGNNAASAAGIDITGSGTSNNVVEGNVIGLGSGGAAPGES